MEIQDSNGSPAISTSIHRPGGLASLRVVPTGPTQYVEMQLTSGVVMRTFHRFYLYITALPAADTNIYGVGQSGYFPAVVRLTTAGALQLRDNQALISLGPATAPLALGQWHRIELDYTDTAGTVTAGTAPFRGYLNGTLFADTLCSNINGFSRVRMGAIQAASGMDICIDDVAVNDDTGSAQTGLPRAGTVVHLRPAGVGDANGWATTVGGTAGAANNWARVSEITPDDATSYNQTAASGTATDDFTLSSASAAGIGATDAIRLVALGARVGSTATTAASIVTRIKGQSGGTVAESPSTSVAVNGWTTHKSAVPRLYQLTTYANPQTGTAWTRAALGTAQIGYRANVSQTTVRRVSALWALVEYARPETVVQLGAAHEHAAGHRLVLPFGAALRDDFADGTVDEARWPDSYGAISESDGEAVVSSTSDYAGYASATAYRLTESAVFCRITPAPAGTASEAWTQVLVTTANMGTDAVVEVDAVHGFLNLSARAGYYDPDRVSLPYDPVGHAWLRIRATGDALLWETAPDGAVWTVQRSSPAPAWVLDGTPLQVQLTTHRDAGASSEARFAAFNIAPPHIVRPAATARTTERALPVTAVARAVLGAALEVEYGTAASWSRRAKLGPAATTGAAHPVRQRRAAPLRAAPVAERAGELTARHRAAAAPAHEHDAALPVHAVRAVRIGSALVSSTTQPLVLRRTAPIRTARTAVRAGAIGHARTVRLGAAMETDSAASLSAGARRWLGAASETAAAELLSVRRRAPLSAPAVRESAGAVRAHRVVVVRTARAGVRAGALAASHQAALGTARETATAPRAETGRGTGIGAARTAAASLPLAVRKAAPIGAATARERASEVAASARASLRPAEERDGALPVRAVRMVRLGPAHSRDHAARAQPQRRLLLGGAAEGVTATSLSGAARVRVRAASAADRAGAVRHRRTVRLGAARAREHAGRAVQRRTARLGPGRAAVRAGAVRQPFQRRMVRTATVADRASTVAPARQRPADRLTPTTTGPALSPTTYGPVLRTGTAGPVLTATTTEGGG
ncbi:hypothetical protein STTU_4905 [Streptomyces sp. Tu6071]|nr:hypothetical protein STTU_4905 [Streptomyces sp. Tu6071]